jgi:uncharacterized protein YjlB
MKRISTKSIFIIQMWRAGIFNYHHYHLLMEEIEGGTLSSDAAVGFANSLTLM